MSRQEGDEKLYSLEELSMSDLIKILSSKFEQTDARQRILHLKNLEGLVSAGRRDLNARVAINRLPAEVLREIFVTTCTVKLDQYKSSHYEWSDMTTAWNPTWIDKGRAVSLMLVCYLWKEITLGTRQLWNCVETYWEHVDHILLERSGRGPLKMLACNELESSDAVAHALQNVEHSSRIQELYWTRSLARENLRMPAPSLKSLALQEDQGDSVPGGSFKLFDNHTPCLERLSLSYLYWLPSNAFAKLTFLALEKCEVPKAPIKLRSLLSGTPNLVDLILYGVADSSYPHVRVEIGAAGMKPVSLTRLRRLSIADMRADDIDYVFRDARLNEDLSISIRSVKGCDDDEQRLLEVVSSWSLNALKHPKELHFQQRIAIVTGASSGLRFEWGEHRLEDWTKFNWPRILSLSSISHLCIFELDAYKGPSFEVRNLLRQTTALETLSVDIEGLMKIVDALTLFRKPTDPPLCPALMTLRIAIWVEHRDCDIILDLVLPHRAQLGVNYLYVGLIDDDPNECWRPRQTLKDQLHGNFESVNFETLLYAEEYGITLPLVCDEETHAFWPPWL